MNNRTLCDENAPVCNVWMARYFVYIHRCVSILTGVETARAENGAARVKATIRIHRQKPTRNVKD